jgi:hypothetical protein
VTDPVQAPDEVEREYLLPDQAPVHATHTVCFVVVGKRGTHPTADQEDPRNGHHHGRYDLHGDGPGGDGSHGRASKTTQCGEQSVEGKVVELHGDQHHANGDPRDGQTDPSSCVQVYDPPMGCRRATGTGHSRQPNTPSPCTRRGVTRPAAGS